MFIGREKELSYLNKSYNKKQFEFIIIYGRRRVGKTFLLRKFIQDKNAIFYSAEENNDVLNLQKFSEIIRFHYGEDVFVPDFPTWEQGFKFLAMQNQEERLSLVIDEVPYIVNGNPSFLSTVQHLIDHLLINKNIQLIFCGSSISFMENELMAHKSPIFGRKTGQIIVEPFDYFDSAAFFPDYSIEEKLQVYGIMGGIPAYLSKFQDDKLIEENVIENMLNSNTFLYDEPRSLMHQELRNPIIYNSIIEAIANSAVKPNEIALKIGENITKTHKYMQSLMELKIIKKIAPINQDKSRKTIYQIDDHLFRFVYRFIYSNKSLVEQGLGSYVWEVKIIPQLNHYLGKVFETVCIQYLTRMNILMKLPFVVEKIGSWWGNNPIERREEEIDIVGLSEKCGLYGECKYKNEKVGREVYETLVQRSLLVDRKEKYFYIFSKSGFKEELIQLAENDERVFLVGLKDLYSLKNVDFK